MGHGGCGMGEDDIEMSKAGISIVIPAYSSRLQSSPHPTCPMPHPSLYCATFPEQLNPPK
jgi:hypothetical protein